MQELRRKNDLEKAFKLIKQLRPSLTLAEFLDKTELAFKTEHYKLFAFKGENDEFIALCGVMPFNVLYHEACLYICDFVVDENLRGKGVGARCLKELENWAKTQGYKELELSSSFFRKEAHSFYEEKMAFEKTGFVFKKGL